jgi:hypothetical protein
MVGKWGFNPKNRHTVACQVNITYKKELIQTPKICHILLPLPPV